MKNSVPSVGTTAEKSTTVETQIPSSHSDGNTFVVGSQSQEISNRKIFLYIKGIIMAFLGKVSENNTYDPVRYND